MANMENGSLCWHKEYEKAWHKVIAFRFTFGIHSGNPNGNGYDFHFIIMVAMRINVQNGYIVAWTKIEIGHNNPMLLSYGIWYTVYTGQRLIKATTTTLCETNDNIYQMNSYSFYTFGLFRTRWGIRTPHIDRNNLQS